MSPRGLLHKKSEDIGRLIYLTPSGRIINTPGPSSFPLPSPGNVLKDKYSALVDKLKETLGDLTQNTSNKYHAAADKLQETLGNLRHYASDHPYTLGTAAALAAVAPLMYYHNKHKQQSLQQRSQQSENMNTKTASILLKLAKSSANPPFPDLGLPAPLNLDKILAQPGDPAFTGPVEPSGNELMQGPPPGFLHKMLLRLDSLKDQGSEKLHKLKEYLSGAAGDAGHALNSLKDQGSAQLQQLKAQLSGAAGDASNAISGFAEQHPYATGAGAAALAGIPLAYLLNKAVNSRDSEQQKTAAYVGGMYKRALEYGFSDKEAEHLIGDFLQKQSSARYR
jgi:ElaB/YqjD/DUF883 family membrane-anchored ribosome-binding protein